VAITRTRREIEEVLRTHTDVSLAAVIGVPHERHGEEVKAVVILNDGATVTEDEPVEGARTRCPHTSTRAWSSSSLAPDDRNRQDPQTRTLVNWLRRRPVDCKPDGHGPCFGLAGIWYTRRSEFSAQPWSGHSAVAVLGQAQPRSD
jgi:AMP-binding enzyme C-terminal domain